MTGIFSRLLDLILQIPPCAIIQPDEGGVLVRGGKYHKTLYAGFYWKWPFYDIVRKTNIKEQTIDLPVQTVDSNKGSITASGYIKYKVCDPKKAILEVFDYDTSLPRQAMSEICSSISSASNPSVSLVTSAVAETMDIFTEGWGIEIIEIGMMEFTSCWPVRLLQQGFAVE